MSTLSLINPEAPRMRYDWKVPVFMVLIQILAMAIQWGQNAAKLDELFRVKDQQEKHLEFIDEELRKRGEAAGEAKGWHDEELRRFDGIDRQLENLRQRR